MGKLLKIAIMFAIPLAMWFITPPEGLSVEAWRLLGFYLMAIVGLVVKPWPAPIILLLSIAGSSIFLNATKNVLSGYASHYSMASILCILPQCGVCKNRTWPSYCIPID